MADTSWSDLKVDTMPTLALYASTDARAGADRHQATLLPADRTTTLENFDTQFREFLFT